MKTHQEKLNELKAEIRKAIPRLMELSEGCDIVSKTVDYFNDIEIESNFIIGKNAKFFGEDIFIGGYFYSTDNFTIIGHEPKLNDVLQWLKIKCIKITDTTDDLLLCFGGYKYYSFWDLSKSKLSDQSEQLINFLHDLIPNK